MPRHLLSIANLPRLDLLSMIERSAALGDGLDPGLTLASRAVGTLFQKTSTRTRTAFLLGAQRLGALTIAYGPSDLQTNTGEYLEDTGRVLGQFLDVLVVRNASDAAQLHALAAKTNMSLINAMTADEHPTQAISDLAMMRRRFGRLAGLRLLYLGEGNNTAVALALACARVGEMEATFLTPPGYGVPSYALAQTSATGSGSQASIHQSHDLRDLPAEVDVVYTTRWQTTGTRKSDAAWREHFAPYSVTQSLLQRVSNKSTVFMHDLPAVRGEDCTSAVLDGERSIAFEQARQKLFSAMAILEWACASTRSS